MIAPSTNPGPDTPAPEPPWQEAQLPAYTSAPSTSGSSSPAGGGSRVRTYM